MGTSSYEMQAAPGVPSSQRHNSRIMNKSATLHSWGRVRPAAHRQVDGPDSAYTDRLLRIMKRWPSIRRAADASAAVQLACMATAGAEKYIGIVRRTRIDAAISAVEAVLDDVAHV